MNLSNPHGDAIRAGFALDYLVMTPTNSNSNLFAITCLKLETMSSLNDISFLSAKTALTPHLVSSFVEPRPNQVAHEIENASPPIIRMSNHPKEDTRTVTPTKGGNSQI